MPLVDFGAMQLFQGPFELAKVAFLQNFPRLLSTSLDSFHPRQVLLFDLRISSSRSPELYTISIGWISSATVVFDSGCL